MNRLRLSCAALAGWMFVLFNVERFHEPLNIHSFVYVIAAIIAVAIVGFKPFGSARLRWLTILPLMVFFLLKSAWGYPLIGQALPITVVEICAITVTAALAHQIAFRLHAIETASAGIIVEDPDRQPLPLETAQSAMYREVRRARQHDRPLAVLSVASTGQCVNPTQDHLLQELQRELLDKFTNARIADLLAKETKDHAIVTQSNHHFVVLLPETDRKAAEQMVRQLNTTVKSALGLKLRIGVSTFPDEEVTLVGLLKRAEAAMRDRNNGERRPLETGRDHLTQTTLESALHSAAVRDTEVDPPASRETIAEFPRIGDPTSTDLHAPEVMAAPSPRSVRSPN